jgi:phosphatidate phosphatase PAH1
MAKKSAHKNNKTNKVSLKEPPSNLVGSDDMDFMNVLFNDLFQQIRLPENASQEIIDGRVNAAIETLRQIAPRDGVEGMLAVQMASTHETSMHCLKRAALSEQTFEGRKLNLKYAEKYLRLYIDQMKALNKHRGKGDQKVTVEHVNVEAGGQAIVGSIETRQKNKKE